MKSWRVEIKCDMARGGLCEREKRLKREGRPDPGPLVTTSKLSKAHCYSQARSIGWILLVRGDSVICPECAKSGQEWEAMHGKVEDPEPVRHYVTGPAFDKRRV